MVVYALIIGLHLVGIPPQDGTDDFYIDGVREAPYSGISEIKITVVEQGCQDKLQALLLFNTGTGIEQTLLTTTKTGKPLPQPDVTNMQQKIHADEFPLQTLVISGGKGHKLSTYTTVPTHAIFVSLNPSQK